MRTSRKRRTTLDPAVRLVAYTPAYQAAFRDLNLAWIEQHFTVEPEDRRLLDDPQSSILDPGGYIAVALWKDEPVGVCGMLPLPHDPGFDAELIKMAVDPRARGMGIGLALGRQVLAKAEAKGWRNIYLESHPKLQPALALYRKLGFTEITGHNSPFARCGIQMSIVLPPSQSLDLR